MAQRKGWESLSPSYRQRLEGAGISQQEYQQGASIKEARGHGRTPEHPVVTTHTATARNPRQYTAGNVAGQGSTRPGNVRAALNRVSGDDVRIAIRGKPYKGAEERWYGYAADKNFIREGLDAHTHTGPDGLKVLDAQGFASEFSPEGERWESVELVTFARGGS